MAIDVVVHGVLGRMGQEVLAMASQEPDFSAIGGVDVQADPGELTPPGGNAPIPLTRDLSDVVSAEAVVVDFTNAEGAESAMSTAAPLGANVVVGSTGITERVMETAAELASRHGVGIVIAPNFALGAVLLTHLTRIAAPFFEYADLTETHHEAKIDAPSGTAISIARAAVEGKGGEFESPAAEKEIIPGTRGGDHEGVVIHSARMPGRGCPPRDGFRRVGTDPDAAARLHRPPQLHAWRCHGDTSRCQQARPRSRLREHSRPIGSAGKTSEVPVERG